MIRHPKPIYISEEELTSLPISSLISLRMYNLRIEKSFTQEELALEANVDRAYIGQIERCEKNVTVFTLQKIAKSLGVDVREFLDFSKLVNKE